jgi:hypothetical protein
MTDEPEGFEDMMGKLLEELRKSASIKAGAVLFGQAQIAYYDTLKESMGEELAYNMLAHTTEKLLLGIATAAGPLAEAFAKLPPPKEEQ